MAMTSSRPARDLVGGVAAGTGPRVRGAWLTVSWRAHVTFVGVRFCQVEQVQARATGTVPALCQPAVPIAQRPARASDRVRGANSGDFVELVSSSRGVQSVRSGLLLAFCRSRHATFPLDAISSAPCSWPLEEDSPMNKDRIHKPGPHHASDTTTQMQRIAPGKVTRTSTLERGQPRVAQAKAPASSAAGSARSARPQSADVWMDMAHRGASALAPTQPASGGGQSMPAAVQAKMDEAFGADFSAVRVHQGPQATAMGALAYTQGADIHFAPGQYDPGSQRGQELLGHELAHVVQQSQGRVSATTQAKGVGINEDAGLEREADVMGARAARGERVGSGAGGLAPASAKGPAIQRVRMNSTREELEANERRGQNVGVMISMLQSQVLSAKYTVMPDSETFIRNADAAQLTLHELLAEVFTGDYYGRQPAEEQRAIRDEMMARWHHEANVAGQVQLSEPDSDLISKEFASLKACVITSLLYVEGGPVLGASSVQELHHTLMTRFPDTWGQYNDDNIIVSLYTFMGYASQNVNAKVIDAVKSSGLARGMVSTGGHMIGFQRKQDGYYLRDNESVEAKIDAHPKKDHQATMIWS
jgi:hypothetical protein